jgi:hypothetical protein
VPLLEFAGLEVEDDEDMVERWANLLANAATESPTQVPPSYPGNERSWGISGRQFDSASIWIRRRSLA